MSTAIECQTRTEKTNPKALRRQGIIPANLYGHNGAESILLTVKEKDVTNLLKEAQINKTLVDVSIPEASWSGKALIREIQSHPWKRTVYHLSFFAVDNAETEAA